MSNQQTITQSTDVALFTGINVNMNTWTFKDIFSLEYHVFQKYLGKDFYTDLKAQLQDYSTAPEYQAGTTYPLGTTVKYKGKYYTSLEATDSLPTNITSWSLATRFDTSKDCGAKYELFFCDFLGPYLATTLLQNKLPYIWTQIHDSGVLQYQGASYSTSDSEEYTRLKNAVSADIRIRWENIEYYLAAFEDDTCFNNFLPFTKNTNCEKEAPGRAPNKQGWYRFS
jgi:hypothetical protein